MAIWKGVIVGGGWKCLIMKWADSECGEGEQGGRVEN
jgi:hypothetical protein